MRYSTVILTLIVTVLPLTIPRVGRGEEQPPLGLPEGEMGFKGTPFPDRKGLNESDLLLFESEPEHYFNKVRDHFNKKRFKEAADELRRGITFIKMQKGRATELSEKPLLLSINDLEKLADAIENLKDQEKIFIRAHHALAYHHQLKAAEAWAKQETRATGYDLRAAKTHLDLALQWSGYQSLTEAGVFKLFDDADALAKKLIEGGDVSSAEVEGLIKAIGKEIETMSSTLESIDASKVGIIKIK